MGFYLIGPLVTLIPLGSISTWAFKPYCDDGLLGISPTVTHTQKLDKEKLEQKLTCRDARMKIKVKLPESQTPQQLDRQGLEHR